MNSEPLESRLAKLEESQMYAERHAENLAEQMAALDRSLSSLANRLAAIEQALGHVGRRVDRLASPDLDATPGSEPPSDARPD